MMSIIYMVILLFIIVVILIAIGANASSAVGTRTGSARSKLEWIVISKLEYLTGKSFYQAHPKWLRDPKTDAKLELDGYNEELKIAVEVQGPQHTKPLPGEDYDAYVTRIERDEFKKAECARRGVHFMQIPYTILESTMLDYLRSRLFDFGVEKNKPEGYIYPLVEKPWRRGD